MTKAQSGQIGGKKTAEKYGKGYMAALAKKGAQAMHTKYKLVATGTSDFILVNRQTGESTRKTISGRYLP
jgi:hypothetical protein